MNKEIINEIIENYDVVLIEKHLIYSFIQNNNLDISRSLIIKDYFKEFYKNPNIYLIVSELNISSLKTLECYLELLIPKDDRKINGAFFTPKYIVDYIIEEITPNYHDKCFDPSCGCGAFLMGLVEYYKKTFKKSIKKSIKDNIYGCDILPYNIERSRLILALYGLLNGEIIDESDFNLYNEDSLKVNWKNKFEVVVGNPPYVRFQDLSDKNRNFLLTKWKSIDNGNFNLYFAFFELGHKLLTSDGKLGYITPNNYFTSLSGLSLRKYFFQNKCVTRIVDFKDKKVFDAQTYTAITFLDRNKNESILFDKISDAQTCSNFLISANGSPNFLKDLNVKKWRLLKSSEKNNVKAIENIGTPMKHLFNIAVGIATLKDEVFFVDSINEKNGYLIKKTERGTFLIEKAITKPVYKISQFKNQEDIENNTLRIITPYKDNNKIARPILEDEFQDNYPKCYEYLISEKEKLKARGKGKKNFKPFYAWGRTQGINRFGKKLLNPTFSKHPRFLFVPEEDAYFTNGYGIYFNKKKSNLNKLFDDSIHEMSKEENIKEVQKILNSLVMDYYVSNTSVSIQGGFPCYQKNFIEKFSIPNFTYEEVKTLRKLNDKKEIDKFLIEKYQLNIPAPNLF